MKKFPAIIKWSGSKRVIASELADMFPRFDRYFEPFVGSGAMIPYSHQKEGYCGDIIPELIDLWNLIKVNPNAVADEYEKHWNRLQTEGPDVYYQVREHFNDTRDANDLLFLSRTCVNGLIRFNAQGDFNNSFHLSRPGINPATLRKQLILWNGVIQNTTFRCQDYAVTLRDCREGDFVFLDPPYGGTKGRYMKTKFDLERLYATLADLNNRNVRWMLTFDGKAGERNYDYAPPADLYVTRFSVKTGNSTFNKVEKKTVEKVEESVYLNYQAGEIALDGF